MQSENMLMCRSCDASSANGKHFNSKSNSTPNVQFTESMTETDYIYVMPDYHEARKR